MQWSLLANLQTVFLFTPDLRANSRLLMPPSLRMSCSRQTIILSTLFIELYDRLMTFNVSPRPFQV